MKRTDISSTPLPQLASREPTAHKGNFGRVLIVGGSLGMAGAPAIAGMASLRSGAGLVTLAVPSCVQATVAGFCPAYMTLALADDKRGVADAAIAQVTQFASKMDVVAIGPGLGESAAASSLLRTLYAALPCSLVVDADGLNALARDIEIIGQPPGPRILTPHPGEFARLSETKPGDDNESRAEAACELAARDESNQTIVVLKGHRTIVATQDRYAVNTTGNPGMATGGTGDCLTGVVAALLGQGLVAFDAARLAVYIHGLAGDLACSEIGEVGLMATDLIDYLPYAFRDQQSQ